MIDRYLSPSELRRLLSALLVVCLAIALAALFAFVVLPGLRNANRHVDEPSVAPAQGESGWLDPTDYPAQKGRVVPPIDPATVMKATPALLAQGKSLYAQTCASCHGATGLGDGPAAAGLSTRPRALAHKDGWKNGTRITEIYKTLDEGLKGSPMVSYSFLPKKDRMALIHYVQSLGAFEHGPEDPKALGTLTRLFASAGEVIPNRIPVSKAMEIVQSEAGTTTPINLDADPVLLAAISDPTRAARTLAGLSGWQKSDQILTQVAVLGLSTNGFAPCVATYTAAQWKELHQHLLRPGVVK